MTAKKQTIFLVMAYTMYEGSQPVRAFMREASAIAFAAKCEAANAKAPTAPDGPLDTPEALAKQEAWSEANERWVKRHPAGAENACCDAYPIVKIPLAAS